MPMILRDYQSAAAERLRAALRAGRRRVLLVSPTGSGKGTLLAALTGQWDARGAAVLVLVHRKEIVEDLHARIVAEGVRAGVLMGKHPLADPGARVQVGSVQTVVNRRLRAPPDYIVFDEAHRSMAASYRKIADAYPQAVVLGSTATPWRQDGRGLAGMYEDVVVAATPRQLIDRGFLCEYAGHVYGEPDLSGVRIVAGDFEERGLARAMSGATVMGDLAGRWIDSARGCRTIAFACDRAHSRGIVAEFVARGVRAEHVDGATPPEERRAILGRLRTGETSVVSNCALLTEGFDCPAVECVILARPTLSMGLYLQMVGRGFRPSPGKERLRIHDHAGCLWRHGLPDADRDYTLQAGTSTARAAKARGVAACGRCGALYGPAAETCPGCGAALRKRRIVTTDDAAGAVSLDAVRRVSDDAPDGHRELFGRLMRRRGKPAGWASEEFRRRTGRYPHWRWLREMGGKIRGNASDAHGA